MGRAHLPGRHRRVAEIVRSVAVGGTGVENNREGIEPAYRAGSLRKVGRVVFCNCRWIGAIN